MTVTVQSRSPPLRRNAFHAACRMRGGKRKADDGSAHYRASAARMAAAAFRALATAALPCPILASTVAPRSA